MTIASPHLRAVAAALALMFLVPPLDAVGDDTQDADALGLRGQIAEPEGGDAAPAAADGAQLEPVPQRRMPADADPYAALGVRLGSFLLFPSLELRSGYSDNIARRADAARAAFYGRVIPALELRSDWSRHELRGRASASYRHAAGDEIEATTAVDAELAGRIDIRTGLSADLGVSYMREPSSRSDPNVLSAIASDLDVERLRGEGRLTHRVGRAGVSLRGAVQKTSYADDPLLDPGALDYRTEEIGVRASYEAVEGGAVFVEAGANRRRYARASAGSPRRGSRGYEALAGIEMRLSGLITGEIGAGYQHQKPDDPFFPIIEGPIFRGALLWEPTPLTTLSLSASLTPEEASVEPLAAGARVAAADLALAHAFRRNLIGTLSFGYSRTNFVGAARRDAAYRAGLGIEYLVSRELALVAEAAHERHRSNVSGDFEENRVEVGVRLRR